MAGGKVDDPLSMWHPRLCDEWRFGGYLHEVMRNKELAKQTAAALGQAPSRRRRVAPPIMHSPNMSEG